MGVWMIATGTLELDPEPNEELIEAYIKFSRETNPYERLDENFQNPWFFDENNRIQCKAGKFAEPSVWLEEITAFFNNHGYNLIGDALIEGEDFEHFWEISDMKYESFLMWKKRYKDLW